MAGEARVGPGLRGGQQLRLRSEDHVRRFGWIILVLLAFAVAALAAGCARVAFHPMLRLVDGKHVSAGLVMTEGTFLVTVKRPIRLGNRGRDPEKNQGKCT